MDNEISVVTDDSISDIKEEFEMLKEYVPMIERKRSRRKGKEIRNWEKKRFYD